MNVEQHDSIRAIFKTLEIDERYLGFGYLNHENRNLETDQRLLEAVHDLNLNIDELFTWCNSVSSRHFMDEKQGFSIQSFKRELLKYSRADLKKTIVNNWDKIRGKGVVEAHRLINEITSCSPQEFILAMNWLNLNHKNSGE